MNIKDKYNGETLNLMLVKEGCDPYAVIIEEGTGDNLWDEDVDDGYVDYINWQMYAVKVDYDIPTFVEWDGGMILTRDYVQNMTVEEICNLVREDIGFINEPLIVHSSEELSVANV